MNSSSIELNYYHEARKILSSSQKINDMLLGIPQKMQSPIRAFSFQVADAQNAMTKPRITIK